jgi:subfamily B ATP-binding cassette protein MsbA
MPILPPRGHTRRLLGRFLKPFTSPEPASRLIRQSARKHWRLLTLNIATNLIGGISEGSTLGVIFMAVSLITTSNTKSWSGLPLIGTALKLPVLGAMLQAVLTSNSGRTSLFITLIGLAVLLQILTAGMSYINNVSAAVLGNRLSRQVASSLHKRILSFSFSCASRYRVGDLLNHIQSGGTTVNKQIRLSNNLLVNLIHFFVYLTILVSISPWLLLVAACIAVAMAAVQKEILPRIRYGSGMLTKVTVELGSLQTEHIQGLRLLHSSGQLSNAASQTDEVMARMLWHQNRLSLVQNLLSPVSSLLPIIAIAIIATFSTVILQDRQSGVLPSLITFVIALQRMNLRLGNLNSIIAGYTENLAGIERLNDILIDSDKQFVRSSGQIFETLKDDIRLQDVSLRYSPELPLALKSIDLTLPRGNTLALVGTSGAGKSSIADLLTGLYDPSEGRILIDGKDLRDLDLASWQQKLGVVSQDTFLFNTTIAANIAHGCPWANHETIVEAARIAQAERFIEALPNGYQTLIGERGYRLSGGQRQRLSLARAILRNPQLLILDEATSALDTESERLVQEAIERFEHNHTMLVIAHRLSTVVNADEICVLEKGCIVERGKHQHLISIDGIYAKLWRQQSQARAIAVPSES